jgi:streptogramin lyase
MGKSGSIGLVSALLLAFSSGGLPAAAWGQTLTEFPLSGAFPNAGVVTTGPDGNLWFTMSEDVGQYGVGRMTPDGQFTFFMNPGGGVTLGIAAGPDGNVWFTTIVPSAIGRITPAGVITDFPLPSASDPLSITAGPDGNLWFAEGERIGRITPSGTITEFPLGGGLGAITAGPDGNLWFTEGQNTNVGRITPEGVLTEFTPPPPLFFSGGIVAGPDGNLWFTIEGANSTTIGRITPAGVMSFFDVPVSGSFYFVPSRGDITLGPDGNLWFTGPPAGIGRISPKGVVTLFKVASTATPPAAITAGPDGNLWFTEQTKIGRLSLPPSEPCVQDERTLCLTGGRFKVTATWHNQFNGATGAALAVPSTALSGFFYFTDPANTELMLKILDFGEVTKVFYGQLTNLEFTLRVFDTRTGKAKTYQNGAGNCGAIDDNAFAAARAAGEAAEAGAARTSAATRCVPSANRLCLLDHRFSVELGWRNQYTGSSGAGKALGLSNLTGSFSFDDPRNLELLVKILNLGDRTAVLYGSLSNLEYTLTVTETATGKVKTYLNPAGTFCGGLDNSF